MSAVETVYAGTLFRSRLEARWACLFDKLQWQWVYEPPVGKGYLPDFLIGGAAPLLIEVKPAASQDDYEDALCKVAVGLENDWRHDILVVGLSPVAAYLESCCDQHPAAGLLGRGRTFATGCWFRCPVCTGIVVSQLDHPFHGRPCGCEDAIGQPAAAAVAAAWASATNEIRWEPRR